MEEEGIRSRERQTEKNKIKTEKIEQEIQRKERVKDRRRQE